MSQFKHFRHKITGQVKKLPSQYGSLFRDVLEEVDPSEANCVDCGFREPEGEPEFPQSNEDPEVTILPLEEPSPRRSRRKADTVELKND